MSCPRCEDQNIIDPGFLEETKEAFQQLTVDMVIFIKEHKIDARAQLPIFATIARIIRIIESL